jgi:hypothetical protein
MADFIQVHCDEYLTEAKFYTVNNAKKYGLEKAIIMNTLNKLRKFKMNEVSKYFPEFEPEQVQKHLEELKDLGIIG